MHKAVVTALGHINERWTDIRGQGGGKGNDPWRTVRQVGNDTKGDTSGVGSFINTPPFQIPPRIKGRKARGVWNRLSIIDLGILILAAREMRIQFHTPPPLKDRMAGVSGIQSRP